MMKHLRFAARAAVVPFCLIVGWSVATLAPIAQVSAASPNSQSVTVSPAAVDETLGLDGTWCPMAHCGLWDTSVESVAPLMDLSSAALVTDPQVSPIANNNLGCTTGESIAVCAYDSPSYPAIVAYNYQDGSVAWTSPLNDLPPLGDGRRGLNAPLLVVLTRRPGPNEIVIAANPVQVVAYTAGGSRLWKRRIQRLGVGLIGAPVSFSIDNANELVTATDQGWIIKLNPRTGALIDSYRMNTNVFINGIMYSGTFITTNSPAIYNNYMYLVVNFVSETLPDGVEPGYLVRVQLNAAGAGRNIVPLTVPTSPSDPTPDRVDIGQGELDASPAIMLGKEGNILIVTSSYSDDPPGWPIVVAVRDNQATLTLAIAWASRLHGDDQTVAAPALYPERGILVVPTKANIYVFTEVTRLAGDVPAPEPLSRSAMITCAPPLGVVGRRFGSPVGLALNAHGNELVAYTNFGFMDLAGTIDSYLGAFAISLVEPPSSVRPLWCASLNPTSNGGGPGQGTHGQAALFRYQRNGHAASGLIVNTVSTGTYIFR
jgi:hypothetical protein